MEIFDKRLSLQITLCRYCKMKSKGVIICHGAIGSCKTTALEYVTKKYRKDGWTIEWMDESFDEFYIERIQKQVIEKQLFVLTICLAYLDVKCL